MEVSVKVVLAVPPARTGPILIEEALLVMAATLAVMVKLWVLETLVVDWGV